MIPCNWMLIRFLILDPRILVLEKCEQLKLQIMCLAYFAYQWLPSWCRLQNNVVPEQIAVCRSFPPQYTTLSSLYMFAFYSIYLCVTMGFVSLHILYYYYRNTTTIIQLQLQPQLQLQQNAYSLFNSLRLTIPNEFWLMLCDLQIYQPRPLPLYLQSAQYKLHFIIIMNFCWIYQLSNAFWKKRKFAYNYS